MENKEDLQPDTKGQEMGWYSVKINVDDCDLCEACITACRRGVLAIVDNELVVVPGKYCNECEACVKACANRAINLE